MLICKPRRKPAGLCLNLADGWRLLEPMAIAAYTGVSWQRISNGVEKVRQRLLRAARALEQAKIQYAVADGNAVAAWVSRVEEAAARNTQDVDIILRRADLSAARQALE